MIPYSPPTCQVPPLKIFLNGASGRMGQRIERACVESQGKALVSVRHSLDAPSGDGESNFDVVLDFSSDAGAQTAIQSASRARRALLVGTTGLSTATHDALRAAAVQVPVLIAPNTSIGIAVMRYLVEEAARLLADDFKISIREVHHTKKLDKPSGTAITLADAIHRGAGRPIAANEIESVRQGEVIGDHEVTLDGPGELLSLRHHAKDRDLFARGALRLAHWISNQPVGLYGLDEWFSQYKKA